MSSAINESKPPIGVKPGWLYAAQRISELAGAIQRYADDEHGTSRRFLMRMWADEILMQLDIWDEVTLAWDELLESEEHEE